MAAPRRQRRSKQNYRRRRFAAPSLRAKHRQTTLPYVSSPQIYAWLYSSYGQPYCQYLPSQQYKSRKRQRSKADRRGGIQAALAREKREITDLPEEVVAFFEGLSEDELETLGKLQETMLAARDKAS